MEEIVSASNKAGESKLTHEEIIDQLRTLFFVAFETTSNNLLIFMNFLARYEEYQTKIRKELYEVFPDGKESFIKGSIADLEKVLYSIAL